MMMPIVSMNKMAMNESVASTCCYREVATPTAVYWEALHGGWIGNGYVNGKSLKAEYVDMKASWRDYKGDFTGAGMIALMNQYDLKFTSFLNPDGTSGPSAWYVLDGTPTLLDVALTNTPGAGVANVGCTHDVDTCKYYNFAPKYEENQHFDSTSAHDSGNWKVPHTAKPFAS